MLGAIRDIDFLANLNVKHGKRMDARAETDAEAGAHGLHGLRCGQRGDGGIAFTICCRYAIGGTPTSFLNTVIK